MIIIFYKMGKHIVEVLHIFGVRAIFLLLYITKTFSWSNEKWKFVYLNQYSPRKHHRLDGTTKFIQLNMGYLCALS